MTRESNALDLEHGVFTKTPHQIALSLRRSAEHSTRRKSSAYRSAMSMLTFYVNRAGKHLTARQRTRLERAKTELRALYGRDQETETPSARPRHRSARPVRKR